MKQTKIKRNNTIIQQFISIDKIKVERPSFNSDHIHSLYLTRNLLEEPGPRGSNFIEFHSVASSIGIRFLPRTLPRVRTTHKNRFASSPPRTQRREFIPTARISGRQPEITFARKKSCHRRALIFELEMAVPRNQDTREHGANNRADFYSERAGKTGSTEV